MCRLCCRIRCFSTAIAGTTAAGATTIRFTTISATGSRSIGKVETDTLGTRHQRTGSGGTVGILGVVGQEADGKGSLGSRYFLWQFHTFTVGLHHHTESPEAVERYTFRCLQMLCSHCHQVIKRVLHVTRGESWVVDTLAV